MYSQIHGEIHHPDCEQHRRVQSGGRDLNVMTPIPMGSHVGSARFSGRSCVQELCPDCGKVPKYPPRVESFAFRQSVDEFINAEWIKHCYVQRQDELPFSEQAFPNSHFVYNSTVMTQTPPEMVHCHTSPIMIRKATPEPQSSFDSVPFRKNKSIAKKKNYWKKAFKAVKPTILQKPIAIAPNATKPTSPKVDRKATGDNNAVEEKISDITVKRANLKSPKQTEDEKGDGTKIASKPTTPTEEKILKVLPPAPTVQKVSISEDLALPRSTSNRWRMSDKHSAKSSEKVHTWMRKEIFYKNLQPQPSTSDENRKLLKDAAPSMAEMSREEHLKQLHQCIRSYIEYLQNKNDVVEPDNSQSGSSDANVVQVDTNSLLNVFSHPLRHIASDLNLTVTQSVTDAVINADGRCSQDPIAQIMQLRNKQYGKVCEKLSEFFRMVRLLDDISGLNKKQSRASNLSKIERD